MEIKNKKQQRIQQRQITITEYFGGVYEFDGVAWKLETKGKEADELFSIWRKGLLKEKVAYENALRKENSNCNNLKPELLDSKVRN